MRDLEEYLRRLRRNLIGLPREAKETILREVRSHVIETAAELGGTTEANVAGVVAQLQHPRVVARNHREIYGYSFEFQALFVFAAALLSTLTLPFNPIIPGSEVVGPVVLAVLIVYLIFVSLSAGKTIGVYSGGAAAVLRLVLFVLTFAALSGDAVPFTQQVAEFGGFVLVSVLLILIGYLPGKGKERWAATLEVY
jgi:uncharacterized membrane protein